MRYRPLLPRSSNAPTTSGRRQLRSSAALRVWQMKRMAVYEALLSLLAAQQQAEHQATAPKYTTFHANQLRNPIAFDTPSPEATLSFPTSDHESPTY